MYLNQDLKPLLSVRCCQSQSSICELQKNLRTRVKQGCQWKCRFSKHCLCRYKKKKNPYFHVFYRICRYPPKKERKKERKVNMQHSHQQTYHCYLSRLSPHVSIFFLISCHPEHFFHPSSSFSPFSHHFLSLTLSVSFPRSLFFGPSGLSRLDYYICLSAQNAHDSRDCHTEGDRSSCLSWLPVTFVLFFVFLFGFFVVLRSFRRRSEGGENVNRAPRPDESHQGFK